MKPVNSLPKLVHYQSNGFGRDSYIITNNGGLYN